MKIRIYHDYDYSSEKLYSKEYLNYNCVIYIYIYIYIYHIKMLYISNIYRDSNDENIPNNSEEENLIELKIKSNGEY